MIARLVAACVDHRRLVLMLTGVFALVAAVVASRLEFDALPDLTTNQVLVLTRASGLTPEEVERFVTRPLETAIGGTPGLVEQRSLSRYGLSALTVVFEDDVAPFLARQMVQERIGGVAMPSGVEAPALGPLSGGLGEIFHFTLASSNRTPAELLELVNLRVAPLLRQVPGIVEVNSWGGEERTLEVRADAARLAARGLTLEQLQTALETSMGSVGGATLPAGERQALLRGVSRPTTPEALSDLVVDPPEPSGAGLVRVGDVARTTVGARPRLGAATANGAGETVYVMAQMLRGANALKVTGAVREKMDEVRAALPADVVVDVIYDRSVLVKATLSTVAKSLFEGALLVTLVLLLMLGSLRPALLVAAAIPLSMLGAGLAMALFGIPGNLMSLGAIDFGLLVDGAVVMVEALVHEAGDRVDRLVRMRQTAVRMARPVFFSVLVILLVYVPVLALSGVDGKLFRPMALTVVFALVTALVLSVTAVPAGAAVLMAKSEGSHAPPVAARWLSGVQDRLLRAVQGWRRTVAAGAVVLLVVGVVLTARAGVEFTPQLDEGDLVIQVTRAPDLSLDAHVVEAARFERVIKAAAPEVLAVVSRLGSPAVATDVMGVEQADVFVRLAPRKQWRPGLTREALVAQIESALQREAPGGEPGFTQPIQMRFNELIGGAVTDVAVSIYGEDLAELRRLGVTLAEVASGVHGAADVRVMTPDDVSLVDVMPRPVEAARAGFTPRALLGVVQSLRAGVDVGVTFDGPVRLPVVLRLGEEANAFSVEREPVPAPTGTAVPLQRVAEVKKLEGPSQIARRQAMRRIVVGFNVRGTDLGSVVGALKKRLKAEVPMPDGYRLEWGGQYETLEEAKARLNVVVPVVLLLIALVLLMAFGRLRPAAIILTHVPFAAVGGVVALVARGMSISLPAVIGFIALSGVAVLNGVVLMTRILERQENGQEAGAAALAAARERARPVLTTALVAALGFVPMMLATGVGAEVQRPLATVVVGGLVTSTLLTLIVLPTTYGWFGGKSGR